MKFTVFIIGLLMVLATIAGAMAENMDAYVDEPTTIVTNCIRNGELRSDANASISIFNSSGALLAYANMTRVGNGSNTYTYIFTDLGYYYTKETCGFSDSLLADGSTSINVVVPGFGNVQVIAQGVAEVDINKTAVSEWMLILPNSTGAINSTFVVSAGSCGVAALNGSYLPTTLSTLVSNSGLSTSFVANSSEGFAEGNNYQVLCNLTLSEGLVVNGIKNFIYINPHMTYLEWLGSIITSLAQILGIVQSTQSLVNETLDISNQTLQIVETLSLGNITYTGSGNVSDLSENLTKVWQRVNDTYNALTANVTLNVTVSTGPSGGMHAWTTT